MKKILTVSDFNDQMKNSIITLMHKDEDGTLVYRHVTTNMNVIKYINEKITLQSDSSDYGINGLHKDTMHKKLISSNEECDSLTPFELRMHYLRTILKLNEVTEKDEENGVEETYYDGDYLYFFDDLGLYVDTDKHDEDEDDILSCASTLGENSISKHEKYDVVVYNLLTHRCEVVDLFNYSGEAIKVMTLEEPKEDIEFKDIVLYLGNKTGPLSVSHDLIDVAGDRDNADIGILDDDLFLQLDATLGFRIVGEGKASVGNIYLMITKTTEEEDA